MSSIRSAASTLLDAVRGKLPISSPELTKFQQPIAPVQRRPAGFQDGFDSAQPKSPRLASASLSATPAPRAGMTSATNLHRDGFEVATRKPVELAPKAPPRPPAKARVNVMRF